MSTRFVLCLDGSFAVIEKGGVLYYRIWNGTDTLAPTSPPQHEEFLYLTMAKHGYIPVISPSGEERPLVPDEVHWPAMEHRKLPDLRYVYVLSEPITEQAPSTRKGKVP